MKSAKSNPFRFNSPIIAAISVAFISHLATPIASASTFYWDNNAATAGFSTASGTWAQNSTTTGRWTTDAAGTTAGSLTQVTANTDAFNFGTATVGLGAGSITVSGSVTMGDTTYGFASGAIVLTGGTAINYSAAPTITVNNATNTINTVVGGAATSLTKAGTGTLILGAANTYTGSTIVSAGSLNLGGTTGSLASTVLTLSGGNFNYTRTGGGTQSFTTTNITAGVPTVSAVSGNILNLGTIARAGGTIEFSSVGAGTVAALTGSNVNGIIPGATFGNTWAVANGAGTAITGLANGSYTLTSAAGTAAANYANNNIDVDNSAGTLDGVITPSSLRFNAAGANSVMLAAGTNAINSGIIVTSAVGNNLSTISGDNLTSAPSSDLVISQQNTSNGLTIASAIVNNTATGLIKTGAGLLTLGNTNTYTGKTIVSAGTLVLPVANTISGTTSIAGTATLQLGSATSMGTSTTTLASGATVQLRNDNTTTFTAPIATPAFGTGSIYNFDVNNANSAVTGKTLTLGNLTFGSNAANTINVTGGNSYALALGTLSTPSNAGGPWAFSVNATTAPVTIAKFSTGSFGNALTLQGGNAITLSNFEMGSNGGNSLIVSGSGTVVTLGSTTLTNGRTGGSAAFTLNSGNTLNINNAVSITNPGAATPATFTIAGGTIDNTTAGTITETGNPTQTWNGNFTFTGTSSLNLGTGAVSLGSTAGSRTVTVNANTLTVGGIIANGTATSLTKSGNGILALSGANTYNGGTTVSAGTLTYLNTAAKPATGTTTVAAGATLGLGVGGAGFFSSADVDSLFANTLAGVTLDPASGIAIDTTAGDFTYASNITSSRPFSKVGANTLVLSGNNSYTGNTVLTTGILSISTAANLGAPSSGLFFDGGTLQITGTTLTSISGLGHPVTFNPGKTVGLDINDSTNIFTVDQVLNQTTGGLTKSGAGTLKLSLANTYSGITTITGGTLVAANVAALGGGGAVNVTNGASGGTLLLSTDTSVNAFQVGGSSGAGAGTISSDRATPGPGITHFLGAGVFGNNTYNFTKGANVTSGTAAISLASLNVTAGSAGTLILNPTSADVLIPGNVTIGTNNAAKTLQLSGTSTGSNISGNISNGLNTLSLSKAGTGTWTLSGANTYTGNTTVSGGTLNITGTLTGNSTSSTLAFGNSAANTAVNLSNNVTLYAITGANNAGSTAVYNQTAGTVTTTNAVQFGDYVANNGGYGYFNLAGGTFQNTQGSFNITNNTSTASTGVAYVAGNLDLSASNGNMVVAYSTSTNGSLTIAPGGTLNYGGSTNIFFLTVSQNSYGVLNMAGGNVDFGTRGFRIGNSGTGQTGILNLDGGTFTLGQNASTLATSSNFYVNYAGGTLKAAANLSSPFSPGGGLTTVATIFGPIDNSAAVGNVSQNFAGGLTVDTNGNSVTLGNPLRGATGNGVRQSNMTITAGSGYTGAPMVTFTGGTLATDGAPASGYAVINPSTGAVTGIVITSPGAYTVDPTVTLTGGGGTGAGVALSPLSANSTDTGLTKIGTGTLTLSGANTYVGATTVSVGTLALVGGSQASPITANSGASLDFTLGSGTTSTSTLTFVSGSTVKITGSPAPATSYTLFTTTATISGTPVLDAPIAGYQLQVDGGNTLKLVPVSGGGYASWKTANSTAGTIDQDHDNDGVKNGVEYFLFGSTDTTGFTALPGVTNTAGTLSVTWTKAASYTGTYNTDFVVETSSTLTGVWTTETLGVNVTITGNNVKYTFPAGTVNFARLKVTGP